MTDRDALETVLAEIKNISSKLPNGELKQMQKDIESMKEDMSDMKYTLLNPENGVIVNTNKNTDFRNKMEANEREFLAQMAEVQDLKRWKQGVTRALWIIFGILASVIIRMLMMHADKV